MLLQRIAPPGVRPALVRLHKEPPPKKELRMLLSSRSKLYRVRECRHVTGSKLARVRGISLTLTNRGFWAPARKSPCGLSANRTVPSLR